MMRIHSWAAQGAVSLCDGDQWTRERLWRAKKGSGKCIIILLMPFNEPYSSTICHLLFALKRISTQSANAGSVRSGSSLFVDRPRTRRSRGFAWENSRKSPRIWSSYAGRSSWESSMLREHRRAGCRRRWSANSGRCGRSARVHDRGGGRGGRGCEGQVRRFWRGFRWGGCGLRWCMGYG